MNKKSMTAEQKAIQIALNVALLFAMEGRTIVWDAMLSFATRAPHRVTAIMTTALSVRALTIEHRLLPPANAEDCLWPLD